MKTKYLFTETFNASAPLQIDSIRVEWMLDESPDLSWLEQDYSDCKPADAALYRKQDAERLAAYHHGEWHMRGVRAVAVVSYPIGNGSRRLETFTSGGLWGIESDCSGDYEKELASEQINELKNHLEQFNIPTQFPMAA